MKIALDVDGVLRNTFMGIAKAYFFNGGHKLFKPTDFIDYDFTKMMDINNKEQFFRQNAETIFYDTKPMRHIHYLSKLDGYIQIITSQFKGLEDLTLKWLAKHNVYYDEIHFTWDKQNVKTDLLLDDLPDNLHKMPEDTIKVCYNAPYNQKWTGYRVSNLKQFVDNIHNFK